MAASIATKNVTENDFTVSFSNITTQSGDTLVITRPRRGPIIDL